MITKKYPDRTNLVTQFRIVSADPNSYGYVFLREIKLWQQYNFNYINTAYIDLVDDVGLYNAKILKSSGLYPGLITYIKSDFNQNDYEEVLFNQKYKLINLVEKDDLGYEYPRTYDNIIRKADF